MLEPLARPRFPALLEDGITVGEKLQDRFLVLQHETAPVTAPLEARALQLRDGGPLRLHVRENEPIAVLPHCRTPHGGGMLLRSVDEDEVGVEMVEGSLD